jgi:hypothetical protein
MSHASARHDPRAASEDEDAATPQARQPAPRQRVPRQPAGQPAGDGGIGPDEPDEGEFEIAGDNDLGPADLGPADPSATNPDAGSGRMRKIARQRGRGTSPPQQ